MSLTVKQEKFCLAYVECGNASEAYRRVYSCERMKPATINRKAKELMDNGKIAARVLELQGGHIQRHDDDVDSLLAQFEEIRVRALATGKLSAAVAATAGKARLYGLNEGPQAINFPLPAINDAEGAQAAMAAVVKGLAEGRLRPGHAKALADTLEAYRRQLDTVEQREMLLELEETLRRLTR